MAKRIFAREGLNVSKSDLQTALEQAVQFAGYTKIAVYGLDGGR